jgi:hypothetical protein
MKEKAIIEMVLTWLDTNIDGLEGIQEDSANLKEKIILALSKQQLRTYKAVIYKDRNAPGGASVVNYNADEIRNKKRRRNNGRNNEKIYQ